MPWTRTPPSFACATCEMSIAGSPVFHTGLSFCCAGCAADGPCTCSYDEPRPRRARAAQGMRPLGADVAPALTSAKAEWATEWQAEWETEDDMPTPVEPTAATHGDPVASVP